VKGGDGSPRKRAGAYRARNTNGDEEEEGEEEEEEEGEEEDEGYSEDEDSDDDDTFTLAGLSHGCAHDVQHTEAVQKGFGGSGGHGHTQVARDHPLMAILEGSTMEQDDQSSEKATCSLSERKELLTARAHELFQEIAHLVP